MLPDSLINSLSMSTAVLVETLTILYAGALLFTFALLSTAQLSERLSRIAAATRRAGPGRRSSRTHRP